MPKWKEADMPKSGTPDKNLHILKIKQVGNNLSNTDENMLYFKNRCYCTVPCYITQR